MRIQVTNDDGIESVGLQVLARRLAETGHDVFVVAPDRDWSGAGACIGSIRPDETLAATRVEIERAPGLDAWALEGPPALTVIAAQLGAFGAPPDLVVSGINAGLNTGRSVLHSGTVGAALTAQNFGISGLAVSVAQSDPWQWDVAADAAVSVLGLLIAGPPRSVVNLNVPAVGPALLRGFRWGRLAPFGAVRAAVSSVGDERLQFELTASDHQPERDTDQGIVDEGYASLTTLVGVTEAWSISEESTGASSAGLDVGRLEDHVVPGAPLRRIHRVPDASRSQSLRRPLIGMSDHPSTVNGH